MGVERFDHNASRPESARNVSGAGANPVWILNCMRWDACSVGEWINDSDSGVHKISAVSRGDRQAVNHGRCRDQAILNRHRFPGCPKARQQFRPFQTGIRIPRQTMEMPDPRVEPAFQARSLCSFGQDKDTESKLAQNDGIDRQIPRVCAKPFHNTRIGSWLRGLAQNVGVDQVLHSESVDSESMGTKKSFCGQLSSQSMTPSFGGGARRTRR